MVSIAFVAFRRFLAKIKVPSLAFKAPILVSDVFDSII